MLRFFPLIYFIFIVCSSQTLWASSLVDVSAEEVTMQELELSTYALDSQANAVVLSDIGKSYFTYTSHDGLQIVYTRYTKIKIFNKQGYEHANISIPIYHEGRKKEEVNQVAGFSYNLTNGKIAKAKLRVNGKFEEKLNDNWDLIKFTMPAVKEGTVIEYSYTITSDFLSQHRGWNFQQKIPVARSEYSAKIPQFIRYRHFYQGYHPLEVEESGTTQDYLTFLQEEDMSSGFGGPMQTKISQKQHPFQSYTHHWVAKDIPAIQKEAHVANLDDYIAAMKFEVVSVSFPGKSTHYYAVDWNEIDHTLLKHEQFGDMLRKTSTIRKTVATLTDDTLSQEAHMQALYQFVNEEIKWNGQQELFASQSLKATLESHSGNAADINLLLLAMLREAGIESHAVALSTREHGQVKEIFPSVDQFNYTIVRAQIGENTYLLDATEKPRYAGMLPARCLNGTGRLIAENQGNKWLNLDQVPPAHQYTSVVLTLNSDRSLTGQVSRSQSDYSPTLWEKESVQTSIKATGKVSKLQNDAARISYEKVQEMGWTDHQENYEDFEVNLTRKLSFGDDRIYLNTVLEDRILQNPFVEENRVYPVDIAYPFSHYYLLNLTLPEGYVFESVPEDIFMGLPKQGGGYSFKTKIIGNTLSIVSRLDVNKSFFLPDEYPSLREMFNKVVAKQSQQLIIRKSTNDISYE